MRLISIVILMTSFYGTSGVTKISGLEQFWTDDNKVFEQIYGKTSDRHIYGAALPATVNQGAFKPKASENKERFQLDFHKDPYDLEDNYNELIKKGEVNSKPATSSVNIIQYTNYVPINHGSYPETYNHLEHSEEVEHEGFPKPIDGFKPYINYGENNTKATEDYKSIQDILNANGKIKQKKREQQFSNHGKEKGKKSTRVQNNDVVTICASGRCKQRVSPTRGGTRPYLRRIKHRYT